MEASPAQRGPSRLLPNPAVARWRSAFSLIELLSVTAILAVLAALATSAFSALGRSSKVTGTANELALIFEQARTYAMAQASYVRVGVAADVPGQKLICAAVAASNGTSSDFDNPSDYRLISRVRQFDGVRLLDVPAILPGMDPDAPDIAVSDALDFQATSGGASQIYDYVVQFSPSGEASLGTSTQARWVQLAIAPAQGRQDNYAVLQVSGLTGQVRVFRP